MIYLQYRLKKAGAENAKKILVVSELSDLEVGDIVEEMMAVIPDGEVEVGFPSSKGEKFDLILIAYERHLAFGQAARYLGKLRLIRTSKIMLYERTERNILIFDSLKLPRRIASHFIEILLSRMLALVG